MTPTDQSCPGCGLPADGSDGPTHDYIGASAACWARYGDVLTARTADQIVVDTYAAQHPGIEERRSIQSVAVHLMSMCAVLERGLPAEESIVLIRRVLAGRRDWWWLSLDRPIGTITVADVLAGNEPVTSWATDVWAAWSPHHDTVRSWLDIAAGRR